MSAGVAGVDAQSAAESSDRPKDGVLPMEALGKDSAQELILFNECARCPPSAVSSGRGVHAPLLRQQGDGARYALINRLLYYRSHEVLHAHTPNFNVDPNSGRRPWHTQMAMLSGVCQCRVVEDGGMHC